MYRTFYYKCVANDNGDEHSLVFSCLLLPKIKALPFKDVIPEIIITAVSGMPTITTLY